MERLNAEIADTEARLAEAKRNVAEGDGEIDDTVRFILNDLDMLWREKEKRQEEENAFIAKHGPESLAVFRYAREYGYAVASYVASKRTRLHSDLTGADYVKQYKDVRANYVGAPCCLIRPSFLNQEESDQARNSLDVNELAGFMTPILQERLLPCFFAGSVLVNSAASPWIPNCTGFETHYMAPTHFVAPRYMVRFTAPFPGTTHAENAEYGSIPAVGAFQSLWAVGEATHELSDDTEYPMMVYLEALSNNKAGRYCAIRGFVYDWQRCTMMTAFMGHVMKVITFAWTTPGTRALMCEYFRPILEEFHSFRTVDIWQDTIDAACQGLHVALPHFSSSQLAPGGSAQCILAADASLRELILKVQRREAAGTAAAGYLAMKAVLGTYSDPSCEQVQEEFDALSLLPAKIADFIVGVVPGSLWLGEVPRKNSLPRKVAAYLMPVAGTSLREADEVGDVHGPRMLESLSELHAAGLVHNNAHYENAVLVAESGPAAVTSYRWTNLRATSPATCASIAEDVFSFLRSVHRTALEDAVHAYATCTVENTWDGEKDRRRAARNLWQSSIPFDPTKAKLLELRPK